ncbi:alkaline phosphatase family protein [Calditerricola satsumensis]|uniref:Sulfatase n=1 Tax=Calditerricola satsumensis TaxID=373054 RepID=A0A8J3B8B3_9BACI|nr:alkaline phosphatase family protein [Calditerricola satsumensis]GGK02866.1 hypothetical protein GCM10007043_16130 [Calditerricola satsumensis]
MKAASAFEVVAARAWNVLNEGKPFTPVFVAALWLVWHAPAWDSLTFWKAVLGVAVAVAPLAAAVVWWDFPLHLRAFLLLPLAVSLWVYPLPPLGLVLAALGAYGFFTVFFWGTLYYRLRIGTPWTNFTRFWKLVLKNSDSTSGNAREQIPKVLLLLVASEGAYAVLAGSGSPLWDGRTFWALHAAFTGLYALYAWAVHRRLFTWKPAEYPRYTEMPDAVPPAVDRVYVVVIDGCRKDRLAEAHTPFLDRLAAEGTVYEAMETVYPARTVVCFSSMLTGTYPAEHGIHSNLVWRLGVRCESIFDSLRKADKRGVLVGIAHLIDAFGDDVASVTAVMPNDEADGRIMARARQIVTEEDPDLLVVQLIAVDQTGHSRGPLYDEYRQKIEEADAHIAAFYEWLRERGKLDRAVFIVCADHGQSDGIGGHAHLAEGERFVPFLVHGTGVVRGKVVAEPRSLVSLAPTLAWLLRAPLPNRSRGPVLTEAFAVQSGERVRPNGSVASERRTGT